MSRTLIQCVEKITADTFRKRGFAESRIVTDWPNIVGEPLASYTSPIKLTFARGQKSDGTLHMQVGGSWALEVQHNESLIRDKINTYFGYKAVSRLSLLQAPLAPPQVKKKFQPTPIPAGTEEKLAPLLADIEDDTLKSALNALGKSVLSQR